MLPKESGVAKNLRVCIRVGKSLRICGIDKEDHCDIQLDYTRCRVKNPFWVFLPFGLTKITMSRDKASFGNQSLLYFYGEDTRSRSANLIKMSDISGLSVRNYYLFYTAYLLRQILKWY